MDSSLTRCLKIGTKKEEMAWLFKVEVDLTDGRGRCIKRFVRSVRKSAKFPSNPAETVRFSAKSVTQRKKIAAVDSNPITRVLRVFAVG